MKILFHYLLMNVKERKARTAVMLLSILLSATLLFVSLSVGASYESAQKKMARGMAGSATLSVTAGAGWIDPAALPSLPETGANVGMLKGAALYHEEGYYESIDLVAADLTKLEQINPPRLVNGGALSDFSGGRIVLPDRFTEKYGIEQGDTVTLQIGSRSMRFSVAAIAAYDTVFLRHTRGATALLPRSTLAGILGAGDGYSEILLAPAKGVTTGELKQAISAALPEGYSIAEVVNETQIAADARQKSMPFFLISFFSLTMSVFIIYSSYKVITLDRLPVIGTFRSIGATQKAVTRLLLAESALYGGIGGLLALPIGLAALRLLLRGMGRSLAQGIAIPIVLTPYSVLLPLAVALGVSLLSALLPVRRASRLPIKAVVLGTVEQKPPGRRLAFGCGAALLALSLFLPRATPDRLLYPAGGLSLLGLIAAAILLIPLLMNLLSALLQQPLGLLFGNEGRLAARNLRDDPNAAQNITLLFISLSAVIAITVVGSFVTDYVSDVFRGAALQGFADGQMDQAFVDQVKDMEGIETVLPLSVWNDGVRANGVPLSRLEATDDVDSYSDMLALHYKEPDGKAQAVSAFAAGRAVLLSESCMEWLGVAVGDTLTLSVQTSQQSYRVADSFRSRATDVEAIIPSACANADFGDIGYGFLAYTAADPDAIMVQLRSLFGDTENWSRTVAEFNADAQNTVGTFLRPMHGMTYLILLLAAVGVVNNLLIGFLQKRRAVAMYRAVGLSLRQNVKMTLIEGLCTGLTGALLAILVSYLEIQTIFLVAGPKITAAPTLDALTFLSAGALGVAITLAGSAVPIRKARRMALAQQIRFE